MYVFGNIVLAKIIISIETEVKLYIPVIMRMMVDRNAITTPVTALCRGR